MEKDSGILEGYLRHTPGGMFSSELTTSAARRLMRFLVSTIQYMLVDSTINRTQSLL